jgi:hypothetical protein
VPFLATASSAIPFLANWQKVRKIQHSRMCLRKCHQSQPKKVAPPRKKTKTAAKQTKKDMTEKKGLETKKQQQVSPQMPRKGTYIK